MAKKASTLRERAREAVSAGMSRADVAKAEGVTYAAVHRYTKDLAAPRAPRGRRGTLLADGSRRSEAMRADFDAGMAVNDIAAKYGTSYQLAYTVTRGYRAANPLPDTEAE